MKKKLLVFTSTFPRWKHDTNPPFVYELSKRLTDKFDISVLAPHYPMAKEYEVMDKMRVHRFRYFFEKHEKLACDGGILPNLKKNKLFFLQVPFFLIAAFFALRMQIKENRPDVIHAHWIIPQGLIAALLKIFYGVPFVVTSHGSDVSGIKGFGFFKNFILENADRITVVSSSLKKELLSKVNPRLKVDIIPMGVDSKLFTPRKRNSLIRKKYKISGHFLLFVGRLSPEKGINYLISAMQEISKSFSDAKLLVVGSGSVEPELKEYANRLELNKNILFVGNIPNEKLPEYYATADIFVSPSIREGFGLTFVEAQLSGCVPVGTSVGGIKDIIENGKTGLLCKPCDAEDLAKKVIFLMENLEDRKKISENAKINAKRFEWNVISKKFNEILSSIK